MTLSLHVDNNVWNSHIKNVIKNYSSNNSEVIPVIKGNGYGIGKDNLAKKAHELGMKTVAVGTVYEAQIVLAQGISQVLIMDPVKSVDELAEMRLYLAEQENICHAACLWVRVGKHVWYTYGASSTSGRELRPSNAIQWQMMKDARDAGANIYDMRGIAATLNEKSPLFGLLRFKIGTGGKVIQYVGEWDFVFKPFIYKAFRIALARRG